MSIKRTSEIEELSNLYFIHPISGWLVPIFARLKITPNMVSITGLICGALSGYCYFRYQEPGYALAGFLFMITWHIMDGADGQLARLTNAQSEIGKIIDGICDYVTFISVYIGLGLAISFQTDSLIGLMMLPAGISHAIQSGAYEVQRQEYDFWGYGKASAQLPDLADLKDPAAQSSLFQKASWWLHNNYVRMQYAFSGQDGDYRQVLKEKSAENTNKFMDLYREHYTSSVRSWAILCANYRTFAIFIACIIGQPLLYVAFELIVLNIALFGLMKHQQKKNTAFIKRLQEDF